MNNGLHSISSLLPYALLLAKVLAVAVVVVLIVLWRGASFARKRAYGPGGGRK